MVEDRQGTRPLPTASAFVHLALRTHRVSIAIGIALWEKSKEKLTPEELRQAILAHNQDYLKAQRNDPDNSQTVHNIPDGKRE